MSERRTAICDSDIPNAIIFEVIISGILACQLLTLLSFP